MRFRFLSVAAVALSAATVFAWHLLSESAEPPSALAALHQIKGRVLQPPSQCREARFTPETFILMLRTESGSESIKMLCAEEFRMFAVGGAEVSLWLQDVSLKNGWSAWRIWAAEVDGRSVVKYSESVLLHNRALANRRFTYALLFVFESIVLFGIFYAIQLAWPLRPRRA